MGSRFAGRRQATGRAVGLLRRSGSMQQATFVELFFDLAVVFAFDRVVAGSLPGFLNEDPAQRWSNAGRTVLLLIAVMYLWTTTAYLTGRFEPHRPGTQVMLLLSTFAMMIMGTAVPGAFAGEGLVFAVVFVTVRVARPAVISLGLRSHRLRRLYWRVTAWLCLAGVFWVGGGVAVGAAQLVWWAVAAVVDLGSARLGWPAPGLGRHRNTIWQLAGHHLVDRNQQLLMIALGESILAVGISYSTHSHDLYKTAGLVIAFATTTLLWRVYFQKAGELLPKALDAAGDPAGWGRRVAFAHALMVLGIVTTAIGHEIVQHSHTQVTHPSWRATILGGPALFLVGRARLEHLVFARVSRRRIVGIALVAAAAPLMGRVSPLATATTAAAVLLLIALLDWRNAAGKPPEVPSPPG
ncbi:low temperature requirement protein A [Micromonospora coerulea]|uniref:Low temperature requirement protein A n=2 Tax=Micromonospora coerulea TaxID=47856 RepID=A0ABP8SJD0_9ACTN